MTAVATDRSPVIALRDVSVRRDGVVVLDGVDWLVRSGERWVILGPNGSGKTTLLALAGARLWPSAGVVEILGARLGRVDVRTLRPRISLVSGSVTRQLRPDLPARHVVVSGRDEALETWWHPYSDAGLGPGRPLARTRPGVGAIGDRPFGVISEGERQQVLLARALMGRPELILLDEPAAGLDLGARERLVTRLGRVGRRPRVPDHGPGHPPLRGDTRRVHPCRAGAPGQVAGGGGPGRCGDLVTGLVLLRCAGDGRLRRRTVVEPRRVNRDRPSLNWGRSNLLPTVAERGR